MVPDDRRRQLLKTGRRLPAVIGRPGLLVVLALLAFGSAYGEESETVASPQPFQIQIRVNRPAAVPVPEPFEIRFAVTRPRPASPPEPFGLRVSVGRPRLPAPPEPFTLGVKVGRPVPPAPGSGGEAEGVITVVRATYGGNCIDQQPCTWMGRTEANSVSQGNVTGHTASACNGKRVCEYVVDYFDSRTYQSKGIIQDPCIGCVKDYEVEWHCGDPETLNHAAAGGGNSDAGLGAAVTLSCQELD